MQLLSSANSNAIKKIILYKKNFFFQFEKIYQQIEKKKLFVQLMVFNFENCDKITLRAVKGG